LAKQADQIDALLGHPTPFTVVEMGAGKGLLARDFLNAIQMQHGSLYDRLRYISIERSPAMRQLQQTHLTPWLHQPGMVSWVENLDGLAPDSITGLFFSNELVDAFPIHRIEMTRGRMHELFVDYADGTFVEILRPPSTPQLSAYLERLKVTLPEGYRTEI